MTFEEVITLYPIYHTLAGDYNNETELELNTIEDVEKLEKSNDPPLEWGADCAYAFMVYSDQYDKFECCHYAFFRIAGYINTNGDPNEFYPASNVDGWYIEDTATLITPDAALAQKLGFQLGDEDTAAAMLEQVAYSYNPELYEKGYVFTKFDQLKKFIENGKK